MTTEAPKTQWQAQLQPEDAAHRIEDVYNRQGAAPAYAMFQAEYTSYSAAHMKDASTEQYWRDVSRILGQDNVLPALSIVWADANRELIARDGRITKFDLKAIEHSHGSEAPLAEALDSQFDKLSRPDPWSGERGIGQSELLKAEEPENNRAEKLQENAKKEKAEAEERDLVAPLFRGTPPLFTVLDTAAHSNGEADGKISKNDLEAFKKNYELFTDNGKNPGGDGTAYSATNYEAVCKLLKLWDERDDKLQKLWSRDWTAWNVNPDDRYLTVESLTRAAGLTDCDTPEQAALKLAI